MWQDRRRSSLEAVRAWGAATGRALAQAGAKVALLDVNREAAEAVAAEIGGIGIGCDVSDGTSAEQAVAAAREAHGAARIAVNCAGVATGGRVVGRDGPHDLRMFQRHHRDQPDRHLQRHAAGPPPAWPGLDPLEDGERGVIVNTSSVAAYDGQIGQAAYSASKGGIVAMTLPVARELARHGIRVMTIAPGLIATPMMTGLPADVQESLVATTLYPKRLGHAEEFADLVSHICENRLLNGEVIRLDGAVRLAPR